MDMIKAVRERPTIMPRLPEPKSIIDDIDFDGIHENMERRAGRLDAEDIFNHLMAKIEDFQKSLSDTEEVGIRLANFGEAAQLHIRSIGFKNPNLIEFHGVNSDDHEVTLVQHVSQLNFLIIALKPINNEPYRVGFNKD